MNYLVCKDSLGHYSVIEDSKDYGNSLNVIAHGSFDECTVWADDEQARQIALSAHVNCAFIAKQSAY